MIVAEEIIANPKSLNKACGFSLRFRATDVLRAADQHRIPLHELVVRLKFILRQGVFTAVAVYPEEEC